MISENHTTRLRSEGKSSKERAILSCHFFFQINSDSIMKINSDIPELVVIDLLWKKDCDDINFSSVNLGRMWGLIISRLGSKHRILTAISFLVILSEHWQEHIFAFFHNKVKCVYNKNRRNQFQKNSNQETDERKPILNVYRLQINLYTI